MGLAQFRYAFDFGDDWLHLITGEESASTDTAITLLCIDGANACPSEDVGGPPGLMDFVAAISHPWHEAHAEIMRCYGKRFDPKRFDRGVANRQLRKFDL